MNDPLLIQALRGAPTSRPPFWFMRQAGRYLPEYRATREQAGSFLDLCFTPDLAVEVTLQPIRRFAPDAAILFADILLLAYAMGQDLAFVEGEGPKLGELPPLADVDPEDAANRLGPVYETVAGVRAALPAGTALIGFAGAPWTVALYMVQGRGGGEFVTARLRALREPALMDVLIAALTEATIAYLDRQIRDGAQAVQLFDSWAGLANPEQARDFVLRPSAAIVRALKERHPDVPVIGFPKGLGARLAGYRAATGVDCVAFDTSVDPAYARRHLQDGGCVQGNLDPLLTIIGGKAMRTSARALIAELRGGPFVFNLGHGLIPQSDPAAVEELADLIRNA